MAAQSAAATNAAAKRERIRDKLWPNASERVFVSKRSKGFAQIPRVVPLVARLINEIGGSENAGPLYQVLWSQDWGQGIVEVRSSKALLYLAGYSGAGSRADRTWRERIRILTSLGFVETGKVGLDEDAYLLLIDPHIAVLALQKRAQRILKKPDQKLLEEWLVHFELFTEQWGIALDDYRKVTSLPADQEDAENEQ